ncbi:MAG TPA: hypothetical protein VN861_02230 [Candidatus Acidoferrales bacterium]|nr:hypothetical protein [Candidatus Acidoferrales bacterium]
MNIKEILSGSSEIHRTVQTQALSEEGQTYFNQILTEYQLQVPSQSPGSDELAIRNIADQIAAKPPELRTWGDLFGLEIAVVKLQSEECLRRGAWAIRSKYKDLVGEKVYDAYQTSNPPDPKTGDIDQLRCDTLQILGEFHWAYAFAPLREKIRSALMKQVFLITTVLVVVALMIAAVGYFPRMSGLFGQKPLQIPVLAVVIALGMIGGYMSLQQRIESVPSTGDPIVNIAELSNSQFSLYLAPISGAVFAVLLYIIFIAGLLTGPLFPKVYTPIRCAEAKNEKGGANHQMPLVPPGKSGGADATANSDLNQVAPARQTSEDIQSESKDCSAAVEFSQFLTTTGPDSGTSYAMLLVWCFIAGFAERFVPDTIDRLVSQAAKK